MTTGHSQGRADFGKKIVCSSGSSSMIDWLINWLIILSSSSSSNKMMIMMLQNYGHAYVY